MLSRLPVRTTRGVRSLFADSRPRHVGVSAPAVRDDVDYSSRRDVEAAVRDEFCPGNHNNLFIVKIIAQLKVFEIDDR